METAFQLDDSQAARARLAEASSSLGYEIVDIAGFLDLLEARARAQNAAVESLRKKAEALLAENSQVRQASEEMSRSNEDAFALVNDTVTQLAQGEQQVRDLAHWVAGLAERLTALRTIISAVDANNAEIADIAAQVNILAINAKIESARAGAAGRGFGVVAEEIGQLSLHTAKAADSITVNSRELVNLVTTLSAETSDTAKTAHTVNAASQEAGAALTRITAVFAQARDSGKAIAEAAAGVAELGAGLEPALAKVGSESTDTATRIDEVRGRVNNLIDSSESIVQSSAQLGIASKDGRFIDYVTGTADRISAIFDQAVRQGQISSAALFDTNYRRIPDTDPPQFLTAFNAFTDKALQALLEEALGFDPKVVFCAAVDRNGYLPTHNLKFSRPQGRDVAWNTANCRNRRLFDDRVGLKAGRNTEPFLLQVYRRDMGGGEFAMMKDLSAPIRVGGRHWGGLRMGYKF